VLREDGHRLRFAKLRNQRGIGGHRHADEMGADRQGPDMDRTLAVKRKRQRKRLAGIQMPVWLSEAEYPTKIRIDRNHEVDAALIGRSGGAIGKGASLVIGVGTPAPITDADRAIWSGRKRHRSCGDER